MSSKKEYVNTDAAKQMMNLVIDTLEQRREQIANRSTVSLAASSGLLVLIIQLIFDIIDMKDYSKYLIVVIILLVSLVFSALAIITSLDLIKRISRKKHLGKNQKTTDTNPFYFGWISNKSESEFKNTLGALTEKRQIEYEIRQSISLAKNLKYRYKQLKKTYIFFIAGIILYMISILVFVIIKYTL